MRDTLFAITLIGAAVAGFYYFTDGQIIPDIGQPSTSAPQTPDSFVWENRNQGGKNDRGYQGQGREEGETHLGSDEIDSGHDEEIQRLTSIYPVKNRTESAKLKKKKGGKGRKVIHGVPIQAFADSQKNRIDTRQVPGTVNEGLRVYLQCMELKKKGTDPLNQKECDQLLVGNLEKSKGVQRYLIR